MKCPYCGNDRHTVVGRGQKQEDERRWGYYRRRRECLSCHRKFWTVEQAVVNDGTSYAWGQNTEKD